MIADTIKIDIQHTTNSKLPETDLNNIKFGRQFSDHMFIIDYKDGEWQDARIVPYDYLPLSPATSAIHYGQSIFEGMKAYKRNGEVFLFRPQDNARRMQKSAARMCMPELPEDIFMEGLSTLIRLDSGWIPEDEESSLYIRPYMFATDEYIGVKASETYKFMIFTCPVNAYYGEPVNVKIEEHYSRSFEGGTGFAKAAGNYAASLYPAKLAKEEGFHQLIWTDANTHEYIEESGTMNVVFQIGDTLISPPPSETILAGITKHSVLQVARDWGMNVEERPIKVSEIIEALQNGTLKDAFGAGTAATIAHIRMIGYRGEEFMLPPVEEREFSNRVYDYLNNLKRGLEEDKHGWLIRL